MIEADIDRYGGLVRSSYLADFLELLALRGLKSTFAQLTDMVSDRWYLKQQLLQMPEEDPEDGADTFTEGAAACINERSEILGGLYPFDITSSHINLRPGFDVKNSAYVALLCVTIAHAYKIETGHNVQEEFEGVVADSLHGLGLSVGNVGEISRSNSMDFKKTTAELGRIVNIPMDPNAAVRRRNANDGGVDVLAHLDWGDRRSGRWTILGQATCGSSDTWQSKLAEPLPRMWQAIMADSAMPLVFLAVPHHVEEGAYRNISENTGNTVVDRPRMVPFIEKLSAAMPAVIEAVMKFPLQSNRV